MQGSARVLRGLQGFCEGFGACTGRFEEGCSARVPRGLNRTERLRGLFLCTEPIRAWCLIFPTAALTINGQCLMKPMRGYRASRMVSSLGAGSNWIPVFLAAQVLSPLTATGPWPAQTREGQCVVELGGEHFAARSQSSVLAAACLRKD